MTRILQAVLFAACIASSAGSFAADPKPAQLSNAEFVRRAALSDMFETKASELAAIKGDGSTRDFAAKMNEAHQKTSSELGVLVKGRAADLPLPDRLDAPKQKLVDRLAELGGETFHAEFATSQVRAHEDAIQLFRSFGMSGPAGPLRDWAQKTLPKLEEHLSMSRSLQAISSLAR